MLNRPARAAVVALGAQRLGELALSKRHEARLRAQGGVEHAPEHHRLIVVLHSAWLLSTLIEARRSRRIAAVPVAIFLTAQLLRYWCLLTLGGRWTTTIMVVPGAERIRSGPYRWFDHPNYAAVAAELAAFPMIFGAHRTAVAGSVANAILMRTRIRAENDALRSLHVPAGDRPGPSSRVSQRESVTGGGP